MAGVGSTQCVCGRRKWMAKAKCEDCETGRPTHCHQEQPPTPLREHPRCGGPNRRHTRDDACGNLIGATHAIHPRDVMPDGRCTRCHKHVPEVDIP